jgi:hypothetical protein
MHNLGCAMSPGFGDMGDHTLPPRAFLKQASTTISGAPCLPILETWETTPFPHEPFLKQASTTISGATCLPVSETWETTPLPHKSPGGRTQKRARLQSLLKIRNDVVLKGTTSVLKK